MTWVQMWNISVNGKPFVSDTARAEFETLSNTILMMAFDKIL